MLGKSVFAIAMFASTSALALSDIHLQFDNESRLTADQQTKALKIFTEITGNGCPGIIKYQKSIDRIVLTFDDDLDQPQTPWGDGKAYYDARFEEYGWTSALNMSIYLKSKPEIDPDFQGDGYTSSSFSIGTDGEKPGIIVFNDLSKASIVCGFSPSDTVGGHRFAPIPELQGLLDQ
ncbi:hypothetical protein [Thalassospira xiamenensis]|uniref:Uncharacterized protein n=1 Tax=Thalassospira xiamenensis TaxID=220697 RepID=A0A285TZ84_9PROT|nr:hypothetical protein [Thalassospira xiamenensis]SOC28188.1 hypothetical protein SAMN05428964_106135 [Thalassospira xiamenensis]